MGFGREDGFGGVALQDFEEVGVGAGKTVEVEEGHFIEEALPALKSLVLKRVGGALAGPCDSFEEKLHEIGPRGGSSRGG